MTLISVRLSKDLREQAKEAAGRQPVSLSQFCVTAIAQAIGQWKSRRFFAQRAAGLSREEGRRKMGEVLGKVRG